MSELKLDINQAIAFLDQLDPNGRHTLASEAPFGGKDNGPRWLGGATFENDQRDLLIEYIQTRQNEKSNVYYGVNRACSITQQTGHKGKANIDDIIFIRALGFDIDTLTEKETALNLIDQNLSNELKPSIVISTGGGYHLIYFLKEKINIKLYRPDPTDEQKKMNKQIIDIRSYITQFAHNFESLLRTKFSTWKIDSMSNIDRVLRLPGTINYPKLEKQAKGQKPELAHIIMDYHKKLDIEVLRDKIPQTQTLSTRTEKKPFIPRANDPWTAYEKAKACIDFIREEGLADSNETYTHHVMLPLIGAIHDENKHNQLTIDEAEELFLEAVSGGERYGTMGRGEGYFRRQWRSHRPELKRNGTKSIGGLIWFCTEHGMDLPWKDKVFWEPSFERQQKELSKKRDVIPDDVIALLKK